MKSQSSWETIKVVDFFNLCPWQGEVKKAFPNKLPLLNWQNQTVADFFKQANWQGLPPKEAATVPDNIMTMKVTDFFGLINWEGDALTSAVAELNSLFSPSSESENNITLDDLSDLF